MQPQTLPGRGTLLTFVGYAEVDDSFEPILKPKQRVVVTGSTDDGDGKALLEVFPADKSGKLVDEAEGDQVYLNEVEIPAPVPAPAKEGQLVNPDSQAGYEYHELADRFPLIEGQEFDDLAEDLRANGLFEEIVLHEGKILDGRNRYRACLEAGVEPRFLEFDAAWGDPWSFVLSRNAHRRHLTSEQRRQVVLGAVAAGDTHAEAAKKAGVTRSAVSKMVKALGGGEISPPSENAANSDTSRPRSGKKSPTDRQFEALTKAWRKAKEPARTQFRAWLEKQTN